MIEKIKIYGKKIIAFLLILTPFVLLSKKNRNEAIKKLKSESEKIQKDIDDSKQKYEDIKTDIIEFDNNTEEIEQKIADLKNRIELKEEDNNNLLEEINNLKGQIYCSEQKEGEIKSEQKIENINDARDFLNNILNSK